MSSRHFKMEAVGQAQLCRSLWGSLGVFSPHMVRVPRSPNKLEVLELTSQSFKELTALFM